MNPIANSDSKVLLEVRNLKASFDVREGRVRAVDGVDLVIHRGEALGIVGESGSGKSITARCMMRIADVPEDNLSGNIYYHFPDANDSREPVDILALPPEGDTIRSIRGAEISMIFQEPMTAFSPVHTIGNQIIEVLAIHTSLSREEARERAIEMLRMVEMSHAERRIDEYPHQLSGGMRQRAMIAMALVGRPNLVLADEPTTALDVTTQAQILDLLRNLREELGMGVAMITHDLGVVAETAERVAVMYLGRVVETADVRTLFYMPKHPYTKALLESIPKLGRGSRERLQPVKGMVPSPHNRPRGCPFHTRCPNFMPGTCDQYEPRLEKQEDGSQVSCFLYQDPREEDRVE